MMVRHNSINWDIMCNYDEIKKKTKHKYRYEHWPQSQYVQKWSELKYGNLQS